jgi:hypothetical protein
LAHRRRTVGQDQGQVPQVPGVALDADEEPVQGVCKAASVGTMKKVQNNQNGLKSETFYKYGDMVVVVGDGMGDRGQLSGASHSGWVGEVFKASKGTVTVDFQFNEHGVAVEAADLFRASQLAHYRVARPSV